ncbi:uncharacterized protein KGF55_000031 [Candida pseudojiufengensis]|uniref:uncharacterized protein n=1 Tax=Candida pseudojiufengensis TaxID=497109 RepID=UPI0022245638|nr:uncharacterized protein KGF55_000031 [Candida pseudojiufengensis]KAI5968047.1 hypothetical protein KGF55_000031 [Candida pseudojiufengensis]
MDCKKLEIEIDPETKKKIINQQYLIIKKIGQGQFGKVFLGKVLQRQQQQNSNSYVAIKTINRIDKSKLITKSYINNNSKIAKEIEILKQCNHPNVVKLISVIDDLYFDKIFLILEHCKYQEIDYKSYNHYYEKYNHLRKNPLNLNKILRDVINGLEYLHDYKNIIHRDIKPSNLLIDENNNIKISDFGVSLILENNLDNNSKELLKTTGTPAFYAPELCQFITNNMNSTTKIYEISKKIDIWSLGITLYSLIFNIVPFNGKNEYQTLNKILNEEVKFPITLKSKRITDDDIIEFNYLKDLIKQTLIKDPNDRITIKEIKNHKFTLFDLNLKEIDKFLKFNDKYCIKKDNGFSSKFKKLFAKNNSTTTHTNEPITTQVHSNHVQHDPTQDLKHVDDLLDSYLDDSSSLSSMDDAEPINTNNLLEDLHLSSTSSHSTSPTKYKPPSLNLESNNHHQQQKNDIYTYQNRSLKDLNLSFTQPPSLSANTQNSKTIITPSNSIHSSLSTPINDSFATIGQPSPTNPQQFFSPKKRFFDNQSINSSNHQTTTTTIQPSIKSLSYEEHNFEDPSNYHSHYHQFERPSSIGSNNSLRRLPSSSSSLNLNGYFNDNESIISNHSITKYNLKNNSSSKTKNHSQFKTNGFEKKKDDTNKDNDNNDNDDNNNDTTINLSDNFNLGIKYKDLSSYLDGLEDI